ncbi:hypothetical protein ACFVMC_32600 [Nocardia sp. NPDC127579]|uniref:hypothetical protein n=1 Tax=Nocardia sp. NPDC127579 TaxID=3345402 RepID=UPI00363AFF66
MDDLNVIHQQLTGFALDLHDVATTFSSNASRQLPGVVLPSGAAELMRTLAPAFEKFQNAVATAHKQDVTTVATLGARLGGAKREYRTTDSGSSATLAAIQSVGLSGAPAESAEPQRFSGLNLPYLAPVEDAPAKVRNVVTAGIDLIAPFDEPLSRTIGIKPAADYLDPLVGDWEALQTVGERIELLGINDHTASENIVGGTNWLQTGWTRLGSQAFGDKANPLGETIAGRSWDFDAVSKIVGHAGASLERLVYNQSVELSSGLTRPMTFLRFTLPLGVWAQLIDLPMRGSQRSQIVTAAEELKRSVKARHDTMTDLLDQVSSALSYTPDRNAPKFTAADFEVPAKVTPGAHVLNYGYGSNMWWQDKPVSDNGVLAV